MLAAALARALLRSLSLSRSLSLAVHRDRHTPNSSLSPFPPLLVSLSPASYHCSTATCSRTRTTRSATLRRAASANDFGVAMGRGDVERLRSDVARASPMEEGECSFMYRYISRESCSQFDSLPLTSLTEALSLCVRHTDWKEAKLSGFVPALATELAALVRSSVGASFLATRTSTARFIVAFAAAAPKSAVKTAGVTLTPRAARRSPARKAVCPRAARFRGSRRIAGKARRQVRLGAEVRERRVIEMHRDALAGTKGNRGGAASNEEAARDAAIAGRRPSDADESRAAPDGAVHCDARAAGVDRKGGGGRGGGEGASRRRLRRGDARCGRARGGGRLEPPLGAPDGRKVVRIAPAERRADAHR